MVNAPRKLTRSDSEEGPVSLALVFLVIFRPTDQPVSLFQFFLNFHVICRLECGLPCLHVSSPHLHSSICPLQVVCCHGPTIPCQFNFTSFNLIRLVIRTYLRPNPNSSSTPGNYLKGLSTLQYQN